MNKRSCFLITTTSHHSFFEWLQIHLKAVERIDFQHLEQVRFNLSMILFQTKVYVMQIETVSIYFLHLNCVFQYTLSFHFFNIYIATIAFSTGMFLSCFGCYALKKGNSMNAVERRKNTKIYPQSYPFQCALTNTPSNQSE